MNRHIDDLSSDEQKQFQTLENFCSQQLELLQKLNKEEKKLKNEDIKSMIRHYISLTDKIEERRNHINDFNFHTLAICATAIGVLFAQDKGEYTLIIKVVLLIQIIFSAINIFWYESQSSYNGYPFLKFKQYGNKWKWFYYGNQEISKIDTHPISKSKKFNETIVPYLNGLQSFLRNYREEDLDKELSDNIQQLYLLQVHNYYKNRFYLQLTKIRKLSFKLSIFFVIVFLCYKISLGLSVVALVFGGFLFFLF